MEAVCSFETLIKAYKTARSHNLQDHNINLIMFREVRGFLAHMLQYMVSSYCTNKAFILSHVQQNGTFD
jgi:hypothetical protein